MIYGLCFFSFSLLQIRHHIERKYISVNWRNTFVFFMQNYIRIKDRRSNDKEIKGAHRTQIASRLRGKLCPNADDALFSSAVFDYYSWLPSTVHIGGRRQKLKTSTAKVKLKKENESEKERKTKTRSGKSEIFCLENINKTLFRCAARSASLPESVRVSVFAVRIFSSWWKIANEQRSNPYFMCALRSAIVQISEVSDCRPREPIDKTKNDRRGWIEKFGKISVDEPPQKKEEVFSLFQFILVFTYNWDE